VEKKKTLKQAREQQTTQPTRPEEKNKNDRKKEGLNRKEKGHGSAPKEQTEWSDWFGKKNTWRTQEEVFKGVPRQEKEEYRKGQGDCWRCGREGHKTFECWAFTTKNGTTLPPAPWKAAAIAPAEKRKREEETEAPLAKQQRVAAVETMETDAMDTLWEESDSDF